MTFLKRFGPALFSGLLLLLAFPPFHLSLLVFVALGPWLASIREVDGKESLKRSYVFGLVFSLGQMFWLMPFVSRWTGSIGLALVPYLLASAALAVFFMLSGWLANRAWAIGWGWAIPLAWAGIEFLRSYLPVVAFPWALVATPLWSVPQVINSAHYGSIYLVSAWVVLANVMIVLFLAKQPFRPNRGYLIVFLLVLMVSMVRYADQPTGTKRVVAVGQLGTDLAFGDRKQNDEAIREAVRTLSGSAISWGADLLVLPEGMVAGGDEIPPHTNFDVPEGVPLLFGGQRGENPTYQSAYAYDGEWRYADKTRLVIFGEFVPGRSWIPFLSSFNLPSGDLTAAEVVQPVKVGQVNVGAMLCFEGLFHNIGAIHAGKGAQLIAVMAIDDWYMGTPAPDQLAAASIWRAVETGLPTVRSASLGYSMAIDGRGNVLAVAPLGKQVALRAEMTIPERADNTLGVLVFPWLALATTVVLVAMTIAHGRRAGQAVGADSAGAP